MASKREYIPDDQVEIEIERLKASEDVKLARKYQRIQYKRRQAMYQLRNFEEKGKKLRALGITMEMLDDVDYELPGIELNKNAPASGEIRQMQE